MHETSLNFSIWKNLEIWNTMPKCPENMLNPQLVAHLLAFWWRTCPILREHWLITMSTSQFLIIFSPPSLDKKSICTLNSWRHFAWNPEFQQKHPFNFQSFEFINLAKLFPKPDFKQGHFGDWDPPKKNYHFYIHLGLVCVIFASNRGLWRSISKFYHPIYRGGKCLKSHLCETKKHGIGSGPSEQKVVGCAWKYGIRCIRM